MVTGGSGRHSLELDGHGGPGLQHREAQADSVTRAEALDNRQAQSVPVAGRALRKRQQRLRANAGTGVGDIQPVAINCNGDGAFQGMREGVADKI